MEGMSVNESQDVVFSVFAETDGPGVEVRIVGSADVLGRWHPEGGVALRTEAGKYPRWSTAVRFPTGCSSVDYKFIKVRQDNTVEWEQCPDRQLAAGIAGPAEPSTPRFGQRSFTTSVSAATAVELPVPAPQLAPVPQLAPPPPLPPPEANAPRARPTAREGPPPPPLPRARPWWAVPSAPPPPGHQPKSLGSDAPAPPPPPNCPHPPLRRPPRRVSCHSRWRSGSASPRPPATTARPRRRHRRRRRRRRRRSRAARREAGGGEPRTRPAA
mmetsp:Transcript_125006/g.399653  ORF Transcript_125006/g.399653 Transcript_125006/m.399653 type:complete len:271 (+) Transcript_125006:108-920(+)